jgi:predicted acyl esterase
MKGDAMRILVDRDVPVEMRDGTVLRADAYRPDRPEGRSFDKRRSPGDNSA